MLRQSALQGDAAAQAALGTMYFDGQGVIQDHPKAMPWLEMAAAQHRPDALLRLGMAYYYPTGIYDFKDPPQDPSRAGDYFHAAYVAAKPLADQGDAVSLYVVGRLFYQNWLSASMPFAQSIELVHRSADAGYAPAECYFGFQILEKQRPQAKEYFDKAAAQGSSCGMIGLGHVYQAEQHPDLAKEWLSRAALLGSVEASRKLHRDYQMTVGDAKLEYVYGGRLNPHGELAAPIGGTAKGGIMADPTAQAVAGILVFSAIAGLYGPHLDPAAAAEQRRYMDEESRRLSCHLWNPEPTFVRCN